MPVVIATNARRCECGTYLNQYNPGPKCLLHTAIAARSQFLPLAARFDRPPLKLIEGKRNEVASGITVAA